MTRDEAIDAALKKIEFGWESDAAAFHRALRERGWVVVPVEPTEEMIAAWPASHHGAGHEAAIYRAMLGAVK